MAKRSPARLAMDLAWSVALINADTNAPLYPFAVPVSQANIDMARKTVFDMFANHGLKATHAFVQAMIAQNEVFAKNMQEWRETTMSVEDARAAMAS